MTDLVIIYNHNFETNVPKLDLYYKGKFNKIWHLIPFYKGNAAHVIAVYGGSFFFQNFIAQAAARLKESTADNFLFIGDDLLLDPRINQQNVFEQMGFSPDWGFISELDDLSKGHFLRGVVEAGKATLRHPGLEIAGELPSSKEAVDLIERHIKLDSLVLRKYRRYRLKMRKPFLSHAADNWNRLKGNCWHLLQQAKLGMHPQRLEYPFVGGYADLFSVPRKALASFAHYCGVFAAAQVFVEIALPTALAFACEHIATEETSPRRGLNIWFPPQTWEDHERKAAQIAELEKYKTLSNLAGNWPNEYLYIHPVKLSQWEA